MPTFVRRKAFLLEMSCYISDCCLPGSDCHALRMQHSFEYGRQTCLMEAFLLVAVFMNQWESSQQTCLSLTVRAVLHSKSLTGRAKETTFRYTKETFQDKQNSLIQKNKSLGFLFMRFYYQWMNKIMRSFHFWVHTPFKSDLDPSLATVACRGWPKPG